MGKYISNDFPISSANGITVNVSVLANRQNYTPLNGRNAEYVVMHYTGNSKDTALANCRYFQGSDRKASAHFFVDEDSIYQSVGLENRAWHCGALSYRHDDCRNQNSVGIEMCCNGDYQMGEKTIENAAALCAEVCQYLRITADEVATHVLRHWDVTGKRCPAPMAGDNNAAWDAFLNRVKALLNGQPTQAAQTTLNGEVCEVTLPVLSNGCGCTTHIRTMQILLNKYGPGAKISEDGSFGNQTEAKLRNYQKSRGLTVDGVCGAKTWAQLLK